MKKFIMMMTALLAFAGFALGAEWRPTDSAEAALTGANRAYIVNEADLTTATTNTAQTLTVSVPDKAAVRFVSMKLETAFDTANTNYTASCLVKVGDGTDDDLYLTSTELASDGSEIWKKFGNLPSVTAATTIGATTSTVVTVSALAQKVYTTADTIDFVFTPHSEEAVSAYTSGRVLFYFNVQ